MEPQLTHFLHWPRINDAIKMVAQRVGYYCLLLRFFYSFPAALIVQLKNKEKISAFPQINSISTSKIGLS